MSLTLLLEAAEYLDRREREAEHGYASSHVPSSTYDLMQTNSKKLKIKKSQGNRSVTSLIEKNPGLTRNDVHVSNNRTTHNELEKNRRAHLRGCLERLKELVPLGAESNRHTTLGLLNKAKCFIRNLEERDKRARVQKVQLIREQRFLLRRLDQLAEEAGLSPSHTKTHRARSVSESSSGISSASTSPTSEVGDIDMESSSNTSDEPPFLTIAM